MIIKGAWQEGFDAMYKRSIHDPQAKNPYDIMSDEYMEWYKGFMEGARKKMMDIDNSIKELIEGSQKP